jgi:dephospho-CoA kinase
MTTKPVIGILGGIGSGKSTVARTFGALGCAVIDADALAHGVLDEPAVVAAVRERFGSGVLNDAGRVDRSRLAERVFDQPEHTAFLNGLIHPRVLRTCEELIDRYQADPAAAAIVLDMPLLLEVGWENRCDILVFVDCDWGKRLERTLKKGKLDEIQLKKREKFQISLDKKKQIAHYRVYNNSDESDSTEQVAQLFSSITNI